MKKIILLILLASCLAGADDLELLSLLPGNFEYTEISYYDLEKLNKSEEFRYTWKTFYPHHYPSEIGDMMPECRQILQADYYIKEVPHNSEVRKLSREEREDYGTEYASFTMGTGTLCILTFQNSQKFIARKLAAGFVESNMSDNFSKVFEKRDEERGVVAYLLFDMSRDVFVSIASKREMEEIQELLAGNGIPITQVEDNQVVAAVGYATKAARSHSTFMYINPLVWKRNSLKQQLIEKEISKAEEQEEMRKHELEHQVLVRVPIYAARSRVDHVYFYLGGAGGKETRKAYLKFLSDMKGSGKLSRSGDWGKVVHPKFELLKDHEEGAIHTEEEAKK